MSAGENSPKLKRATQLIRRIWPWAIVALGFALTAAWISILVYGAVKIIEIAV